MNSNELQSLLLQVSQELLRARSPNAQSVVDLLVKLETNELQIGKFAYNFPMAATTATAAIFARVDGKDYVVLGTRSATADAFPNALAAFGGFLEVGKERLLDTIVRELREEIGFATVPEHWQVAYLDDKVGMDPRYEQVINQCFYYVLSAEEIEQIENADLDKTEIKDVRFVAVDLVLDNTVKLAFNHNTVVKKCYDVFLKNIEQHLDDM